MPIILVALGAVLLVALVGTGVHAVPPRAHGWARATRTATGRAIEAVHDRIGTAGAAWTAWYTGLLLLLLGATSLVGIVLVGLVATDGATPLDRVVLDFFHLGRTPLLSSAWNVITFLGDSSFLVPLALIAGLLWRWRRGDWFVLSVLGMSLMTAGCQTLTTEQIALKADASLVAQLCSRAWRSIEYDSRLAAITGTLAGTAITCTSAVVLGNVGIHPGNAVTQTNCTITGAIGPLTRNATPAARPAPIVNAPFAR